jgi:hypothetical protein
MAFDTSIFGLANKPTAPLQTPMDSAMKQLAIQQAQQNLQAGNIDMQAKQAAMASAPQMLELKRREAQLAFEKNMRESDAETRAKAHSEMSEFVRMATSVQKEAKTPQDFMAGVQALVPIADPDGSKGFAKFAQNLNPQTLKLMTDQTMDHKAWLEREFPKDVKVPLTPHPAIGPDGKPGFMQLDESGRVPAGWKPIPQAAITIDNRNKAAIEKDFTQHPLYAQAKSISDMKQGLPMRQGKQAAELNSLIAKIREDEGKPPYDANQWTKVKRSNEYFTGQGKAATTLTSNDTLYGHADEVLETLGAAALNDTRALNTINQFIARQTGGDAQYKDLKVASKVYAMELAGMLGEKDMHGRQQIMDLFSTVDSAKSFNAAVEQSKKMAATRSASLANQYYRETGLDPVEAGIIPERVAKGAVNSVAASGYEWAKKYRTGSGPEGKEPPANSKPASGTPDIASIGKNARFPKAAWTKDGPDGPGWYERLSNGGVRKVE